MSRMTRKTKEAFELLFRLVLIVPAAIGLTYLPWIDLKEVLKRGEDFQYNLISLSATVGGFLFTGISLLTATIENDLIKSLWNNNYLDDIYLGAFTGIFLNVLTIFAALAMVIMVLEEPVQLIILRAEIVLILASLVFFVWNSFDLISMFGKTKKSKRGL